MKDEKTKDKGRDVFISYASDKGDSIELGDRQAADNVCSALESRDIRCWIAPRDILGGAAWGKEINAALSKARVMVLVFTSSADNSNYVELGGRPRMPGEHKVHPYIHPEILCRGESCIRLYS